MPLYLLLKAVVTKTITVPQYTKGDGTIVPAHQKTVHYDPDKTQADVINGNGTHSQKLAHAQLKNHKDWNNWSDDEKEAHIRAHGMDIHKKRMQADAVSRFKAAFGKDGKLPQSGHYLAFLNEPPEKQAKILEALKKKHGESKVNDVMNKLHDCVGKKPVEKQQQPEQKPEEKPAEQPKQEEQKAEEQPKKEEKKPKKKFGHSEKDAYEFSSFSYKVDLDTQLSRKGPKQAERIQDFVSRIEATIQRMKKQIVEDPDRADMHRGVLRSAEEFLPKAKAALEKVTAQKQKAPAKKKQPAQKAPEADNNTGKPEIPSVENMTSAQKGAYQHWKKFGWLHRKSEKDIKGLIENAYKEHEEYKGSGQYPFRSEGALGAIAAFNEELERRKDTPSRKDAPDDEIYDKALEGFREAAPKISSENLKKFISESKDELEQEKRAASMSSGRGLDRHNNRISQLYAKIDSFESELSKRDNPSASKSASGNGRVDKKKEKRLKEAGDYSDKNFRYKMINSGGATAPILRNAYSHFENGGHLGDRATLETMAHMIDKGEYEKADKLHKYAKDHGVKLPVEKPKYPSSVKTPEQKKTFDWLYKRHLMHHIDGLPFNRDPDEWMRDSIKRHMPDDPKRRAVYEAYLKTIK